jgi:hypothetical protein
LPNSSNLGSTQKYIIAAETNCVKQDNLGAILTYAGFALKITSASGIFVIISYYKTFTGPKDENNSGYDSP